LSIQARSASLLVPAVIAGILGGIVVDAFLSIAHHISPITLWTGMAAAAAGPGSPWWIGLLVHAVVSIVWAILYAYIASAAGQLRNWLVCGLIWGVLVTVVMAFIVSTKTGSPWSTQFMQDLLGTAVFYALPMSFYLARTVRRA